MAVLKCKMCGGDLNVTEDSNVVKCEFCETTQTVLMPDNEKKTNLYNRANRLRFANEFDKAAGVFESLVAEFPEEAEAYWGLCLCKYGIEYVDDPATGKKIPTCHRTSYESIFDDQNFELALEYADPVAKSIYREEAKSIDRIQKGILEIANKEEPFDIFICYKETDENGERTIDSVLAQDIYDKLTERGYKVFFSRITLEDKLGQEYEPYIFSALNSAKIMLVIGTKYEYFEAVWVKNEWSRFLDLMKDDKDKTLIPCYRDIDAYDMPREFKNLQGQDMGKLGFLQDLVRGIDKLLNKESIESKSEVADDNSSNNPTVNSLLERVEIFLSDGNWQSADQYCERVLDIEPKNAQAYLFKLMASVRARNYEDISNSRISIRDRVSYKKAYDFGDADMRKRLDEIEKQIKHNIAVDLLNDKYNEAVEMLDKATTVEDCTNAKSLFEELEEFKDSKEKIQLCYSKIDEIKYMPIKEYNEAVELYNSGNYREALLKFFKTGNYKDSRKYLVDILKDLNSSQVLVCGFSHTVRLKSDGTVEAVGINGDEKRNVSNWKDIVSIACGFSHTVGLKSDGTVVAAGYNKDGQCNVSGWRDIVSIACSEYHTVGLKSDGTVVAAGYNKDGECNVSGWKDIVSVACSNFGTVGVKSDGTVVAAGFNEDGKCNVSSWKDIVSIACGFSHTVGLKSDGTVVAAGYNKDGQCNVSDWKDIVSIACEYYHTVGLKSDGTVVAAGNNEDGWCNVSDWKNIVSVACGNSHTVGLKSDGTVVAAGYNRCGQCNVSSWKDIVSVACGGYYTVGLKSDGTVVAVGDNSYGQCDVQHWRNIDHFTNVKKFLKAKENIENAARERINKEKENIENAARERISKAKAKIKELEEIKRNKNEYKNKLNEQLKEIYKEINKVNSDLENIGLALFGKKAAMRKEMKDKLDSLNKNEQDINMKLRQNESELSDLQSELADNYGLL